MASNKKSVQKKSDDKRAGKRARVWTCLVYQDSAADDWQNILREQLVECLISPLHDKDVLPDNSELKKPHYHVVISFKSPCLFDKAQSVFDAIGGVAPNEDVCRVKDFRQMARYLIHLDQPDKYRYSINDVVAIGAIDYQALIMSAADEDEMLDDICAFIDANNIISFRQFCFYVRTYKKEWRSLVYNKKSYFIREYMKGLAWELREHKLEENSLYAEWLYPDLGED